EHEPPEQAFFWQPLDDDEPYEILSESGGGSIRFNLTEPVAHWILSGGYWGMMVPRHRWEDIEDPVDHVPDPPIGTGPFRWVSWDQGSRTVLEKYDDCWLWDSDYKQEVLGDQYVAGPGPDRMIYAVVGSVDTLVGALQNGDIDSPAPTFTLPNARQAATGADHLEWDAEPGITPTLAWPDRTTPIQRDLEYRVAFEGYALNYSDVVEQIWEGQGRTNPASIEQHPSQPWFPDEEDITMWGEMQDFDRAREVLAQAGYTWDGQDRLVYPEGEAWAAFVERTQPENLNTRREELGQPDFS
ncbi:MAG: ABC transporter substrate-binding protein, partial [Halobacteriales archaeon]|nr:ABC transporter substrate-binding protein [Halobacteriales archaeon]